jgi:iron complex transport system substrate-binding protein
MLSWLTYLSSIVGGLLIAALLAGGAEPIIIVNYNYDLSENVEIFTKAPSRVITTNGSATELLLSFGLEDRMVGTAFLDNPPLPEHKKAYESIPVLSRQYPGKEQVLVAEPDFIVGWHSVFAPQNLGDTSYWNKLGVATMILRDSSPLPKSIDNIYNDILDIGRIFHMEDKAAQKINEIKSELAALAELTAKRDAKLKVIILECYPGFRLHAWGDETTPGQMLSSIGVENGFPRSGDQNRESIVAADPDTIIFIYMDHNLPDTLKQMESFRTDSILKYTKASINNRMGVVPLSETYCPGVRIVMGIRHMSEILFPEERGKAAR